jgi:hypothetical protein
MASLRSAGISPREVDVEGAENGLASLAIFRALDINGRNAGS